MILPSLFKREPYTGPRFRAVRSPHKNYKKDKNWWHVEEYKEGRWQYIAADFFTDEEAADYVKELDHPRIVYACQC